MEPQTRHKLAVASRSSRTAAARRDILVILIVVAAMALLLWNGSALLESVSRGRTGDFGGEIKFAAAALVLNLALIFFGWRRYIDLQHEAELRADGERRSAILAATDAITGLANRKGFAEGVQALNISAAAAGQMIAILSIQMQRFKKVNDRHGYDTGDQLLRQIAATIVDDVPPGAVVARLSGDEFAVALAINRGETEPVELIGEALLRSFSRSYEIGGTIAQVGAFGGIASQPADASSSAADLLRRADIALDRAKNSRSARPTWFDAGMERALIERSELEQAMRMGIEHDEFVPFFEPQVDLRTGVIVGFEVLARWQHPMRGLIGPDLFIPVAEEIGLIGALSEKVITAALLAARDWDHNITVSVNISPVQLADPWLAQKIVRLLTETNFPASRLVVEITEGSLFADLELAKSIVTSLKFQGIRLALDDFGTGFSSLSHLRSLPLDVIKVDRSFIATIHKDRESAAIVRAVTTLASAIGVPVTVEGIEDAPTHAAVLALGAKHAQGWYFGKPMAADQAADLLLRQKGSAPASQSGRRTAG